MKGLAKINSKHKSANLAIKSSSHYSTRIVEIVGEITGFDVEVKREAKAVVFRRGVVKLREEAKIEKSGF